MPRFIFLKDPWPCTIFCSVFIHYALIMLPKRFYWLAPQYGVNYCFVHNQDHKSEQIIQLRNNLSGFTDVVLLHWLCSGQEFIGVSLRCHDLCASSFPGPTPLSKMTRVVKEKRLITRACTAQLLFCVFVTLNLQTWQISCLVLCLV